ncbi:MAG: hypothetical protein ACRC7R_11710 [Sarcina sp.]
MIKEVHINNKSSYKDFNLKIIDMDIQSPIPRKITETVPYLNGAYDFSRIFNFGERVYDNRKIDINFYYLVKDKTILYSVYSSICTWLYNLNGEFKIDTIRESFRGSVVNLTSFKTFSISGKFKAEFECYPFKLEDYGFDLWDDFNFETDVTETNSYEINEIKNITLINKGISKAPNINCSSNMTLTINNKTFNLNKGENNIKTLRLKTGENKLIVKGNGRITFNFRKEIL